MSEKVILLKSAEETQNIAAVFSAQIQTPCVIYLEGQLGAGKTTFVRGFLRGLGFSDSVKSPTFTLIETYHVKNKEIVHADLYRLTDPRELELMGFRDYCTLQSIVLIEWASNAKNDLPKPNLICHLTLPDDGQGRLLTIKNCNG